MLVFFDWKMKLKVHVWCSEHTWAQSQHNGQVQVSFHGIVMQTSVYKCQA